MAGEGALTCYFDEIVFARYFDLDVNPDVKFNSFIEDIPTCYFDSNVNFDVKFNTRSRQHSNADMS